MENEIISHGFVKHPAGKPCKICDRKAKKATQPDETERVEPSIKSEVPEVKAQAHKDGQAPTSEQITFTERTYTETEVGQMLVEIQESTTKRVFQTLRDKFQEKQDALAGPFLTIRDLQQLEESYAETDSQSPSGE